MKEQSKNAVLYLRCSSERQAQKDLSLPAQLKICQKYAADAGFTVMRIFEDAGKSAFSGDREAFLEMIEFCKANHDKVSAVICYDTSRFARNRYDAAIYKRLLKNKGVRVHYASQNINSDEEGGFLMEGMLELFDEHYSRALARMTLRGMIENARRGYQNGANPPYAYRRIKIQDEKGNPKAKLEPIEAEAASVRKMYELADRGYGFTTLRRKLCDLGFKDRRGKPFGRSTIEKILKDQTYIGNTVFNKKDKHTQRLKSREEWIIVENTHSPIVEKELFERVQKAIKERSPDRTHGRALASPRLFSEILHCATCGGRLTADTTHRPKHKYSYYTCRTRRFVHTQDCPGIRLPSVELDSYLLEIIMGKILSPKNVRGCLEEWNTVYRDAVTKNSGRKIRIQRELHQVEKRRANVVKAIADGVINLGDAKAEMEGVREEKTRLELELADLEKPSIPHFTVTDTIVESLRKTFIDLLDTERPVETKSFIRKFVDRIDVSKEQIKIHYALSRVTATSPLDSGGSDGSYLRPALLVVLGPNPN